MVFHSIGELRQYIISHSKPAVEVAEQKVFQIMEDVMLQFYGEYDPVMYDRTFQLLTCCVKTDVVSTGSGWKAEVYFDAGMLGYLTGSQPSGEQVLQAAKWGRHGAMGLAVANFKGTPIMDESISRIASVIFPIMKSALIAAGIPVK